MAGCMIVVVALLGTVLAGFCLDVSKETRPTTDYDYVTDVTGLFDIGQAPQYIEYSPSTNFTGFADINAMDYSWSSTPNAYRVMLDPGPTMTTSITVGNVTNVTWGTTNLPNFGLVNPPNDNLVSMLFGSASNIATGDYSSSQPANVELLYVGSIKNALTDMNISTNNVTLTIDMGQSSAYAFSPLILWHKTQGNPHTYIVDFPGGGYESRRIWYWETANGTGESGTQGWGNSSNVILGANDRCRMTYNPVSELVDVYRYDANTDTEKYCFSDTAENIWFSKWYNCDHTGYLVFENEIDLRGLTINASYIAPPVYDYINPADGVALNNSSSTTWSNGYHNDTINIIVSRASAGSNNLTIRAGSVAAHSEIQVSASATGNLNVTVYDKDGSHTVKVLGKWDSAQVTIRASDGTVSVTPIVGTPNYTESVESNGTTVSFTNWWDGGDIDSLTFSTTGTSLRFGITSTWVFLDTYQSVMTDPSITVSDYFPTFPDWRLNFYSFALTGSAITINGQTYNVTQNQMITVGEGDDAVTGTLSNVYLSKLDNEFYFTFGDTDTTVDLGPAVSDTVSFTGRWYFTTGLYEAVPGIEEYYEWNLDGKWHATNGQILMVFFGLLAFGTILAKGVAKIPLRSIDGGVLFFAGLIAFILGGMVAL